MLIVTTVLLFTLFTDALPWLRGPAPDTSVWHWPYELRPFSRWWAAIAGGILFWVVLGWWLYQKTAAVWQTTLALALLFASCLALQWGLLYADRPHPAAELIDRTLAVQTNGYFWTAAHIKDINTTLRSYPTEMARFESDHARTHPPGLVVANWFSVQLMQQSPQMAQHIAHIVNPLRCTDLWLLEQPASTSAGLGIWAILPLILGAVSIFPAYALAKNLTAVNHKAKLAVLVAAVPALLIFAPLPDQIFSLLTLLIVATYQHGWRQQTSIWLFLSGLLLSIATFLSVGNAALLIVFGCYTLFLLSQQKLPIHQVTKLLAAFSLGLVFVWLLYWLGWSVAPWEVIQVGLDEHFALVSAQRSYNPWLIFNLLDLAIFLGVPAAAAFASAVFVATTKIKQLLPLTEPQILASSTAVLIIILDLSGSTRGEVGRIWLFFMPLMIISGALWLAEWFPDWRIQWGWAGLQIIWAIVLGLSWRPVEATILATQPPAFPTLPENSIPLDETFGSQITLNQAALSQTSESITVTLAWQATGPTERPYTVFNHLLDADGNLVAQADNWPVNGQWPPTCWQADESIVDQHQIELPTTLKSGTYTLRTGLYDAIDNSRLLTATGNDHAIIGQIVVPVQ